MTNSLDLLADRVERASGPGLWFWCTIIGLALGAVVSPMWAIHNDLKRIASNLDVQLCIRAIEAGVAKDDLPAMCRALSRQEDR